jgi:hypothetical protein
MPSERWRVGDITITKVVEGELSVPLEFFGQLLPTSSRAEIEAMDWLHLHPGIRPATYRC